MSESSGGKVESSLEPGKKKISREVGKTNILPCIHCQEKAPSDDPVPRRTSKPFATRSPRGNPEMTWRVARLDIQAAFASETETGFDRVSAGPPAAEALSRSF